MSRFSREEVRFLSESRGEWAPLTSEMRIPERIREKILLFRARKLGRVFAEFRQELRMEQEHPVNVQSIQEFDQKLF